MLMSVLETTKTDYFDRCLESEQQDTCSRLRWSRGSVLSFRTQVRGVQTRPKPLDFSGQKKILSAPSFRGEVKPSVPCRRFTSCKKIAECYVEVGHFQANLIGYFSPMQFHLWLLGSLEDDQWRRLEHSKNKKVHKHLHLWPLGPHRRRLAVRAGTSKGSTISQYGCSTFGALATEAQQKEEEEEEDTCSVFRTRFVDILTDDWDILTVSPISYFFFFLYFAYSFSYFVLALPLYVLYVMGLLLPLLIRPYSG